MCGIVAAVGTEDILPVLVEGLRRLEYRGYDSAGVALVEAPGVLERRREVGKVAALEAALSRHPLSGNSGIAHTRWATHGAPSQGNAHPHVSGKIAVVHNGIIENHGVLRERLASAGYRFVSETDTEVIAHLIDEELAVAEDLADAVARAADQLEGAYAMGVIHADEPGQMVGMRQGSPLVVGVGEQGHYLGSDPLALLPVTYRFIYLEDGDLVVASHGQCRVHGFANASVRGDVPVMAGDAPEAGEALQAAGRVCLERPVVRYEHDDQAIDKGEFPHYMLKEIHEQPLAVANTLEGRLGEDEVLVDALGPSARTLLGATRQIHLVACGTSYHAALVARYWLEELAGVPCQVEVASEYRYRRVVAPKGTLFVTLSQSGETADTLAALRHALSADAAAGGASYLGSLAICNVPGSSLAREATLALLTHAGPEIGVASTKAFTTQLTALMLLTLSLRQVRGGEPGLTARLVRRLRYLPTVLGDALALDEETAGLVDRFTEREHSLFLGRGVHFPIALEGALKLKEISYIHAEAFAAGELKHGPLALIAEGMPVVTVAPMDGLVEKLASNLQEVRARGGKVLAFADPDTGLASAEGLEVIWVPAVCRYIAPIVYSLPLQLLSYHVAVARGTDVDKPRNLAKSVTVE
ncbi:glutamine--fructose-6-phosphate transaminase (isomerizing) [Halomonas nitroreducens]|uniref:Glutamine--fructose-6-phosphate aminotransferase [isomerizing] n=1 Tax=Halomonas nitroreducens TaxID=447425 RepID=A0A3S0JAV9_9GAMM|nr:glutamine--fructose-6-phosphate transaminase (isomerizing) [Halomonas nitroreducens]RTR05042.1 glutamine--fructose-6-phosphate transaminase (isomerizing) [Halomonas nitroreducens]